MRSLSVFMAVVGGVAVGAALGVLFAPEKVNTHVPISGGISVRRVW